MSKKIELPVLLASALHFGHKTQKWNPKMKRFIFGEKNGVHIFDLTKTAECLERALEFLRKSAAEGKTILLISTKQQTSESLPTLALSLGLPYITEKWIGGLLTNWNTTKERLRHLRNLKKERDETAFSRYVKSERTKKLKEIDRLELWFSGISELERRPDVVFVLDTVRDRIAVKESVKCGIPVVGMADSNSDPDLLTYPIPGNDDALKAINYILHAIHDAIEDGQRNPILKTEPKNNESAEKKVVSGS